MKIWLPTIRAGSGADVFALRIAEGMRRAGHEPVIQWFAHRYELMPWALKRFPAPAGTDVVHAASGQAFAFKREGIPLVVTEHHYVGHPAFAAHRSTAQMLYHKLFISRCLARSFAQADAIVAVSQNTADAMKARVKQPVQVILNWIDTDEFSPKLSNEVPARNGKLRVLFVGNPSRRKGADLLARYAESLSDEIELWCLGGLRSAVSNAAMPANMIPVPRVNPADMANLYRQVDAVIVPAYYEAFGYVALEAMSCGLPVLGFDTTGTAEICVHGETALLAPIGDLEALVNYTRQLLASRELRARLGAAGRARAVAHFGEETGIRQYIDVYERVRTRARKGQNIERA